MTEPKRERKHLPLASTVVFTFQNHELASTLPILEALLRKKIVERYKTWRGKIIKQIPKYNTYDLILYDVFQQKELKIIDFPAYPNSSMIPVQEKYVVFSRFEKSICEIDSTLSYYRLTPYSVDNNTSVIQVLRDGSFAVGNADRLDIVSKEWVLLKTVPLTFITYIEQLRNGTIAVLTKKTKITIYDEQFNNVLHEVDVKKCTRLTELEPGIIYGYGSSYVERLDVTTKQMRSTRASWRGVLRLSNGSYFVMEENTEDVYKINIYDGEQKLYTIDLKVDESELFVEIQPGVVLFQSEHEIIQYDVFARVVVANYPYRGQRASFICKFVME